MGRIESFLQERLNNGLFRTLNPAQFRQKGKIYIQDREYVDFSSNDYLGLSCHSRLKEAAKNAIDKFSTSACASRLLSGDLKLHHQLEERIASFKGKESALVFNSGYQANLGIISSLCRKGDVIFCDRASHASIIDGIILSGARFFRFSHNDTGHLEFLLKKERDKFKEALIITETVFSMDGDRAPLQEIVTLKDKYRCLLMVDEAHATGIFGKNGAGIIEEEGLNREIELIMGTFSKALGSFGAYLACSRKVRDYLINSCRGFIYSTAPAPSVIAASIAALELIKEEPFRRKILLENADYFRDKLKMQGFQTRGSSQIIPLIIKDTQRAVMISQRLREKGYWVLPIRPPTVTQGQARLRFSLTYFHAKDILDELIGHICQVSNDR
jgi:8-amino-7-oxononanoate synthase